MKSFVSLCVILVLFQTLVLGSLVKIELQDTNDAIWGTTSIDRQAVLDPYLLPANDGINQNLLRKNECVPFHTNNAFASRYTLSLPNATDMRFGSTTKYNYSTIPVFLFNGTLRI